jgi:hypothetical protein
MARGPRRRIAELSMLSEAEHELLIGGWPRIGTDGFPQTDGPPDNARNTSLGGWSETRGEATR